MKKQIIVTLLWLSFFIVCPVLSQGSQGGTLVAEVNIHNAQIISQEKNKIDISFDLSNGNGIQPQVKYGVQLVQDNLVVDEKVYDELLNLEENKTISKEISYEAPGFLKGEYQIKIIVKHPNAMLLAVGIPDEKISLQGSGLYIEIDNSSCYLQVEGEKGDIKYTSNQGVDVSREETLIGKCKIVNHYTEKMDFKTNIQLYRRSTFGEKILSEFKGELLSMEQGEEREISFVIPKADEPQAYDAKLVFTGAYGSEDIISNSAVFHYVLRGASATIQNVKLDKDYYSKGEIVKVFFLATLSVDSFYGSRAKQETVVENPILEGIIEGCSEQFTKEISFDNNGVLNIEVPIIKDCQDPKVILTIKDGENILDKSEILFKSTEIPQKNKYLYFGGGFLALIIVLSLIFVMKKKKIAINLFSLFFLLSLSVLILMPGGEAKADTWVSGQDPLGYPVGWITYNYTYTNPSATNVYVRYNGYSYTACDNNGALGTQIKVYHDGVFRGALEIDGVTVFARSTVPGDHTVKLEFLLDGFFDVSECFENLSCFGYTNPATCDLYGAFGDEYYSWCTCLDLVTPVTGICSSINLGECPLNGMSPFCQIGNVIGSVTETYTVAAPTPDVPTCTASWDKESLTAPGSSTITWSSSANAVSAKFSCTGPLTGSGDWGSKETNGSLPFSFLASPLGTEVCTMTVKNSDGAESQPCSDSLDVVPSSPNPPNPPNPSCTPTTWTPALSTVCSGTTFIQTSNCGTTQSVTGTKTCPPPCTPTTWAPPATTECNGVPFTQSNGCTTQTAIGVKDCSPKIADGSFSVSNVPTGGKPTASWQASNSVRCDLESSTGYMNVGACNSASACASTTLTISKPVLEETTYTLTCFNSTGDEIVATFTPLAYFDLLATPNEVEVDFAGGGATTTPPVELEVTSWNGFRGSIPFTSDVETSLPESPGSETTTGIIFSSPILTFNQYYTFLKTSLAEIFASYRFTGDKIIKIFGDGVPVDITIQAKKTTPVYEPI